MFKAFFPGLGVKFEVFGHSTFKYFQKYCFIPCIVVLYTIDRIRMKSLLMRRNKGYFCLHTIKATKPRACQQKGGISSAQSGNT